MVDAVMGYLGTPTASVKARPARRRASPAAPARPETRDDGQRRRGAAGALAARHAGQAVGRVAHHDAGAAGQHQVQVQAEVLDRVALRVHRARRLKWLDLHNLLGIATLVWTLVVGVTGVVNTLSVPIFGHWQSTQLAEMTAPFRGRPPLDGPTSAAQALAAARAAAGLPPPVVDLHPKRPDQRGVLLPSGVIVMLAPEPSFEAIAAAGGAIVKHADAHPMCGGFFFGSGAIDRVTSYETGLVGHHSFYGERGESDPLIMDERYVAAAVRGRGVTVFSACSHAGIVNACLGAQQHFSDAPIDVVLGGYHLSGKPMEPRIEPTVRDLQARVDPRLVAPGHCTGWRAKAALAQAFAPAHYAPSVVGSTYTLRAEG